MLQRARLIFLCGLGCLAPLALALAGPPILPPSSPPPSPDPHGFWLSVELLGPRGAQLDGAKSLATPPVIEASPRGGTPPAGEVVGRVDDLATALRWVDTHAFSTVAGSHSSVFGGRLLAEHEIFTTALVLAGEGVGGGTRIYPWPAPGLLPVPDDLGWRAAELVVPEAPLFAAPSARVPPASERFSIVSATHEIWLLEQSERCVASECLYWARILARDGDRFSGGWILASTLVPRESWFRAGSAPACALRPSHRSAHHVVHVLHQRQDAGFTPPLSISSEHVGPDWPEASLGVVASELAVFVADQVVHTQAADLDLSPLASPHP